MRWACLPVVALAALAPALAQDMRPPGDTGSGAPLLTVSPEAVREMMGVWRGRVTTGSGAGREIGLELRPKDEGSVAVTYMWGPGGDRDDPPGITSGEGRINFNGTIDYKFVHTPPYEITLVMALDLSDELVVLWNELDTQKLLLRRLRMQLRRVAN